MTDNITELPDVTVGEANAADSDSTVEQISVSDPVNCTASETRIQQRMLELFNDARAQARSCGLEDFAATGPLSLNDSLAAAAKAHSDDMAENNFLSHTGSDGSSVADRVSAQGYSWRTVGENIAAGRDDAEETLEDWLDSPGHCSNIMNPAFVEMAVSCSANGNTDYGQYWTNVLAAPR